MSEQQEAPQVDEAKIAEARSLGWADKPEWRGDPEHWVDAETFLRRGKEIMPLLKATNRQLEERLAKQAKELSEATTTIKEFEKTLKDITEFQAQVIQEQVESRISALKKERIEAREAGEDERIDSINDEIADLNEKKKAVKAAPTKEEPKTGPQSNLDPAFVEWKVGRDWLEDPVEGALALGIAQKLRRDGNTLVGKEFYDAVEAEVFARRPGAPKRPSKVEGGAPPSGGGGGGGSKSPSYDALPAEAKVICDRQAEKFVGEGKGKMFKTIGEWRTHYAKLYTEA